MNNLNFFIYNYNDEKFDTGVPISNFKYLDHFHVDIISGDEIITFIYKNGRITKFDAADLSKDSRIENFFDYSYDISTEPELFKWLNRKESYDYNFS